MIDKSPKKVRGYINLGKAFIDISQPDGVVYFRLNLIEKAIDDFITSTIIKPGYALAYYNLGIAYTAQNYLDKAVASYNAAIALGTAPVDADSYFNRGVIYAYNDDLENAVADFEIACSKGNVDGCKALKKAWKQREVKKHP